ncbi:MAG: carboxypeptidase-like regulatory domain-containing protein, partial [Flavobacteriaceae bacterium]
MKGTLLCLTFAFFTLAMGNAQTTFSGRVLDENNDPLPGASIVIQGSSTGVASDFDGNFEIELPQGNEILVVSYIGYVTQEFDTSGQTSADIALQTDSQSLEEVVVTA